MILTCVIYLVFFSDIKMQYYCQCLSLLLSILALSLIIQQTVAIETEGAVDTQEGGLSYILNNLRQKRTNRLSLLAPPYAYHHKLAPFLQQTAAKRGEGGFWIWMPAQGYISVPKDDEGANAGANPSKGSILRYGRK